MGVSCSSKLNCWRGSGLSTDCRNRSSSVDLSECCASSTRRAQEIVFYVIMAYVEVSKNTESPSDMESELRCPPGFCFVLASSCFSSSRSRCFFSFFSLFSSFSFFSFFSFSSFSFFSFFGFSDFTCEELRPWSEDTQTGFPWCGAGCFRGWEAMKITTWI
jgi:hypothetical protein